MNADPDSGLPSKE